MFQHFVFNCCTVPGNCGTLETWDLADEHRRLWIDLWRLYLVLNHKHKKKPPEYPLCHGGWKLGYKRKFSPPPEFSSLRHFSIALRKTTVAKCCPVGTRAIATSVRGIVMTQGFPQQSQLCWFFLLGRGIGGALDSHLMLQPLPPPASLSQQNETLPHDPWSQSTCAYRRSKVVKGLGQWPYFASVVKLLSSWAEIWVTELFRVTYTPVNNPLPMLVWVSPLKSLSHQPRFGWHDYFDLWLVPCVEWRDIWSCLPRKSSCSIDCYIHHRWHVRVRLIEKMVLLIKPHGCWCVEECIH